LKLPEEACADLAAKEKIQMVSLSLSNDDIHEQQLKIILDSSSLCTIGMHRIALLEFKWNSQQRSQDEVSQIINPKHGTEKVEYQAFDCNEHAGMKWKKDLHHSLQLAPSS
jgi:hypothetical protein